MRIEPADHYNREVGEVYEVKVEDSEGSDRGPYNEVHEAELIAERSMEWRQVSPLLLAYQGFSKSKSEAIERICPNGEEPEPDREVSLLVFLRLDKAKEFVASDVDVIPGDFQKEHTKVKQ